MKLGIDHNLGALVKALEATPGQLRFAGAVALTKTGQDVRSGIRDEMSRVFDRPTPYALNGLMLRPATKDRLEAEVWVKDDPSGSGTPADKFLGPEIFGGARSLKGFERALQRIRVLPQGMFCTPGPAAEIDSYGNMSRSQIVQLMSYLSAFEEQGFRANATARTRASRWKGNAKKGVRGFEYFVLGRQEGKLIPGIYKRMNYSGAELGRASHLARGAAKAVVFFVRKPAYQKRLDFFRIANAIAEARLPINYEEALKRAMATAILKQQGSLF